MSRRLLATRRLIPLDRLDEYHAAWNALETAARAAGARAWIFRRVDHQDQFIEFIEWQEDGAPSLPERPEVAEPLRELETVFGPGHTDEWEEVPAP